MSKFSVGTKVVKSQAVKDKPDSTRTNQYQDFLSGAEGVVTDIDGDNYAEDTHKISIEGVGYFWTNEDALQMVCSVDTNSDEPTELVNNPKHYNLFEEFQAIEVIAAAMTEEMFKGYCYGNLLKYKLRCGAKDDVHQELKKAEKYKELFSDYKHLCKED